MASTIDQIPNFRAERDVIEASLNVLTYFFDTTMVFNLVG